jgi:hypothetical protein
MKPDPPSPYVEHVMSAFVSVKDYMHEDVRIAVDATEKEILIAYHKASGVTCVPGLTMVQQPALHQKVLEFGDIVMQGLLNRIHKDDDKEVSFLYFRMELYQNASFSVFILRQSRKDAVLCGKAACTNADAAQPQQKNAAVNVVSYFSDFSEIYLRFLSNFISLILIVKFFIVFICIFSQILVSRQKYILKFELTLEGGRKSLRVYRRNCDCSRPAFHGKM